MDLSVVFSRALAGIDAPLVRVETHLSNGLPSFNIVGLPETTVRESKDRVRSAILNSHFEFPDRRITINLAPADLPKEGGRFDLPIALGILCASEQIPKERLPDHEFLGELALDGCIRSVTGTVSAAAAAAEASRALVVETTIAGTAALVPASKVLGVPDLLSVAAHLNGAVPVAPSAASHSSTLSRYPDMRDVVGQQAARRALEIAASGGHSLLFSGPPGTGKTLLASRLPGILPAIDPHQAIESLAIRDIQPITRPPTPLYQRPFRSPHHSASAVALAGGGSRPVPGEISLAHGGVLFLDELPEFNRHSLEMLREPMEAGEITLSRARSKATYPASFQLIAAMNPCPCGYLGDPERHCRCTPDQVQRYLGRLSGPLLDRIDLHVKVTRLPPSALLDSHPNGEDSATIQARVCAARQRQQARQGCNNNALSTAQLLEVCNMTDEARRQLESTGEALQLSGRGLHRSLRVARTIADLEGETRIQDRHICEAVAYRCEAQG